MDKQDTLRNLLIAGAAFVLIMAIGPALLPTPPAKPLRTPEALTPPAGTSGVPEQPARASWPDAEPPTELATDETKKPPTRSPFSVIEVDHAEQRIIGASADDGVDKRQPPPPFRMRLVLSNLGASVESALLTDHAARLKSAERYALLSPVTHGDGQAYRSLAVEKINIDGVDVPLHDKRWNAGDVEEAKTLGNEEAQKVAFWIDIAHQGEPALRVTRTFKLPRQPKEVGRHDLHSEIAVQNLSETERRVVVTYRGPVGIGQINPRGDDRVVDFGLSAADGRILGSRKSEHDVTVKQNIQLYARSNTDPDQRLSWAAMANTYFTCTIAPVEPDGKRAAQNLDALFAFDADGDPMTTDDATLRFVTAAATLAPKATLTYFADVYLGEKDGRAFREIPEYRDRNYYVQIAQGFGWCTFNWLVELMIWLLNGLYFVVRDFGVAIIILVLIVRAMLHPLTKKGQVNMVRMQHRMAEMAPKIEEIKKKYANDKARMNQEMMKLNINPAGQLMTCLPMFIQMPIWVALFLSLSNNILMRHEPFLFTWVKDLTAPDSLIPFSSPLIVPFVGWHIASFNLLPLLVSVFMYLQQKTQPKPPPNPNLSAEQRQQQDMMQKMMPMMSIMMLLIFYNMPSGLNLYIMFSSLFGWLEQMRIRQHIKEQEAAGTLHVTPRKPDDDSVIGRPRKSGKPSFLERIQKMAADAQKTQRTHRAKTRR